MDCVHDKLPAVCDHLDQARADVLTFASFPTGVWTQICYNAPVERLNREIRRRTDSLGIFPNPHPWRTPHSNSAHNQPEGHKTMTPLHRT